MTPIMTDMVRRVLQKLADAGKPTELGGEELLLGKILEERGLLLFVRNRRWRRSCHEAAPRSREPQLQPWAPFTLTAFRSPTHSLVELFLYFESRQSNTRLKTTGVGCHGPY